MQHFGHHLPRRQCHACVAPGLFAVREIGLELEMGADQLQAAQQLHAATVGWAGGTAARKTIPRHNITNVVRRHVALAGLHTLTDIVVVSPLTAIHTM